MKSINYGDEFGEIITIYYLMFVLIKDLDGYDQLVQLMPQFPMIFPSQ